MGFRVLRSAGDEVKPYALPRIGRYRVFDPVGPKRHLWRCRLCGAKGRPLTLANVELHWDLHRHAEVAGAWGMDASHIAEKLLELRIRLAMALRRQRSHLRRSRWEYKVGRGRE